MHTEILTHEEIQIHANTYIYTYTHAYIRAYIHAHLPIAIAGDSDSLT